MGLRGHDSYAAGWGTWACDRVNNVYYREAAEHTLRGRDQSVYAPVEGLT